MRAERYVARQTRAKVEMGLFDVRFRWQRVHFASGDARNCDGMFILLHYFFFSFLRVVVLRCCFVCLLVYVYRVAGNLQNGRLGDENAGGREHPREANGQNFPPDGPQQGRQTQFGGVHRGCQK